MSGKSTSARQQQNQTEAQKRAERLKAALKSNMGRRKAQARARDASGNENKTE